MQWPKRIIHWWEGRTLCLSVPFTWLLPEALRIAQGYYIHDCRVRAGGPAVDLMPEYLADVAEIGGNCALRPLVKHNPFATFTTRGCPNRCGFCAVPKIEGDFRELDDWEPRPIVCDNNLLASSRRHFDRVVDSLKGLDVVDFNQGLDARLFRPHHARRLAELKNPKIRFAFDHLDVETTVKDAVDLARKHGLNNLGCYVLVGFRDTPEEAVYRLETVRSWKIRPNPMRYQPLDELHKNSFVAEGWTDALLKKTMAYYSGLRWFGPIPFESFQHNMHSTQEPEAGLFP